MVAGGDETRTAATDADPARQLGSPAAVLRFLAVALRARAAVEVGTNSTATPLALLDGMIPEGSLTCITLDTEVQRAVQSAVTDEGHANNRVRLITGVGTDVLPRLTESAYDLVHLVVGPSDLGRYLELATPLLRPGGTLVFNGIPSRDGGPGDATVADATSELIRTIHADETVVPVAIPVGTGLLALARR